MFPEIDLLTNLIVQLKWLRGGLEALREGNPLPPIHDIPEGPIGELIQVLQQVEQKFQNQLDTFRQTSRTLEVREEELRTLKALQDSLSRELQSSKESNERQEEAMREIESRVGSLQDRLSRTDQEKAAIEKYLGQVEAGVAALGSTVSREAQSLCALIGEMKSTLNLGEKSWTRATAG